MPFYWLVTTVILLKEALGLVHDSARRVAVSSGYVICSYLLIPCRDASKNIAPIISPGWTLSFEMFFYVCLAAALWSRRPVVWVLTGTLGVMAIAGGFRTDGWPTLTVLFSPLLFEFLGGLWLGHAIEEGWRPRTGWVAAAGAVALIGLWVLPEPAAGGFHRLRWGVLAYLVVQATVVLEREIGQRIPRCMLLVGDASYSLYLTHAPLLGLWTFALKRAGVLVAGRVRAQDEIVTAVVCLAFSVAAGIVSYRMVERPLNDAVRRWTGRRDLCRSMLRLRSRGSTELGGGG